ncbi:MAG: N-acetylmuramoyl-L-alanine amidase, partial [Nitrospira sp.]|nr:N-acetylmuramoyl-L-alanine amidase [Nitrospira sp.]
DAYSGSVVFEKAKTCQEKLQGSSKLMKYRHEWEKCITLYKKSILSSSTPQSVKEEVLFHLTELYLDLARFSGKSQDIKKAEEQSQELKLKYPDSHFIKIIQDRMTQRKPQILLARLNNVRYWSYPDYTRVVFDLSRAVTTTQKKQSSPERLWINFHNTQLENGLDQKLMTIQDGILTQVKAVQQTPVLVHVMLDLGQATDYRIIHFSDPDRVVVDVFGKEDEQPSSVRKPLSIPGIKRIMIDPGHGGKDPGAIGRNGLTEKDVVLDVGLRLKEMIKKNLGLEVLMTRDRDVFIPLEERTQLANGKQADLFISIHANASPNRKVHGLEIYTLGQATDSSALATAARENSIQEDSMKNLDGIIKLMLTDLSIMKRLDHSLDFADRTRQAFVRNLGTIYDLNDLGVKQAPFYVLMNAGMPSILAEISFISNPVEEKRLRNRSYREKIAHSLLLGVQEYILGNDQSAKVQGMNNSE